MKRQIIIAAASLALFLGVALACYYAWSARRARYEYSGTVETREIQIGSKVGDRVTLVPFEEGSIVKAGALLVRFECDDLKTQRAQTASLVDQAQDNLDRMLRGNRPEEIEQAEDLARAQHEAAREAENGPRVQKIAQARDDFDQLSPISSGQPLLTDSRKRKCRSWQANPGKFSRGVKLYHQLFEWKSNSPIMSSSAGLFTGT
ncbi:MAG: hypothetical protein ABR956_02215 [Terracidiphilus sp.]|jgi:multidrug efflux pump subunit AcrA (membrane-fusion protein)